MKGFEEILEDGTQVTIDHSNVRLRGREIHIVLEDDGTLFTHIGTEETWRVPRENVEALLAKQNLPENVVNQIRSALGLDS